MEIIVAAYLCSPTIRKATIKNENIIMCDSKGVIYKGRKNIDQFKSAHAIETKLRTLEEAIKGSDVYFDITLNSNIIDFKKLIDISPMFFLLDTEDILAFKYNPDDTKYP